MNKIAKVCVVINKGNLAYSETFIKAHIERLGAKVLPVNLFPDEEQENIHSFKSLWANNKGLTLVLSILKRIYILIDNKIKILKINKFFKTNKIDVLLAEYGMTGVRVMKACKSNNIPLVVHFHGYDAYKNNVLEKFRDNYKRMFDYASAIIVVSKDMQSQLIRLGAPQEKLYYNVYGVDLNKFSGENIEKENKQLISVGRFVEKKAPYLTLLAFSKCIVNHPNSTLLMIGSGELLSICKQLAKSLKIDKNVKFLDALAHEKVGELMRESIAFVQHSLVPENGDSEGTPNTILEAQASGLPIISTLHAGIKDVVIHNQTGFLVEEGEVDKMAEYLNLLLEDRRLAITMGENAKVHAMKNFSIEKSISSLSSILESVALSAQN
ncbi:glycosyltransferase [Sabulibacter ruber]|uniref:glycosyltransferase n=1 Tax=Sabulibacter ruber TaxID=2811901 RepID=UPI001A960601|nr:glycosyltransferase [Sabulibacter ruber]